LDLSGCKNDDLPITIADGLVAGSTKLTTLKLPTSDPLTIGANAFENTGLTAVTIPDNVESIGTDAFANNAKLATVNIENTKLTEIDAWFNGCSSINTININSSSITKILAGAFAPATGLKNLTIAGDALTTVEAGAFATGITTLVSVDLVGTKLESVANICDPSKSSGSLETFKFPTTLKGTLPSFKDCKKLATITAIPAGITAITSFKNCQKLTAIDLSATGVKTIPANAFEMDEADNGTGSTQIMVKGIGQWKTALAEVKLNAETTTIGDAAFKGCSKLAKVNLTELTKLEGIGEYAFAGTIIPTVDLSKAEVKGTDGKYKFTEISKFAFADNTALTTVTLAPGITTIKEGAFSFSGIDSKTLLTQGGLTTVNGLATANLEKIERGAFAGAALPELDLTGATNEKFHVIPTAAFAFNSKLATVTLPKQIDEVQAQAFLYNVMLGSINLNQTDITVVENLFTLDGDPSIEVPMDELHSINLVKDASLTKADGKTPLSPINTIAEYAFQFTGLTGIVIPETVKFFGVDTKTTKANEGATSEGVDNGRVFQGCVELTNFEWKNVDATITTLPVGTFKGNVKLESVIFLALAATSSLEPIKDKEVFFMCDKDLLYVTLTPDHYNVTDASGYGNVNRVYSTLKTEGNVQFAFSEKGLASDGYYYATYYNDVNASWFDATKFDVFSAVVDANKVVLKPATADAGYYKVAKYDSSKKNEAQSVCVVRSKDIKAVPELKSNDGSAYLSTFGESELQVADGINDKGSKLNYIFKLANVKGNVAFYRVTSGVFAKGKVFIEADPSAARLNIVVEGEGDITGIENIFGAEEDNAPVYNMQGARVNAPQKGIYIKNGKKFIVK